MAVVLVPAMTAPARWRGRGVAQLRTTSGDVAFSGKPCGREAVVATSVLWRQTERHLWEGRVTTGPSTDLTDSATVVDGVGVSLAILRVPGHAFSVAGTTSTNGSRALRAPLARALQAFCRRPRGDFLAELAGNGAALELGVGTGRIALLLTARSRARIELSPAMVAKLQSQPGASAVGVTVGDFAIAEVGETFTLVYLLRNTITNLITQDEQVECSQRRPSSGARRHLRHRELHPQLQRLPPGESIHVFRATPEHLAFEEYDVAAQIVRLQHWFSTANSAQMPLDASLPMAIRVGSHGPHRRADTAAALERLAPSAFHQRQPKSHLGVGEDRIDVPVAGPHHRRQARRKVWELGCRGKSAHRQWRLPFRCPGAQRARLDRPSFLETAGQREVSAGMDGSHQVKGHGRPSDT